MKNIILISLAFVLVLLAQVNAREITVNADGTGDYPTIQDAINDSSNGDVIILQPGTYTGTSNRDIDFKGLAVTVRSTDPNDPNIVAATIINCNGTIVEPHRGFKFHCGEGPDSVASGFTIINGFAPEEDQFPAGGAIFCTGSSPTVMCCKITNCTGYGIIWCEDGNPTIRNCTISANWTGWGGGIRLYESNATIADCNITDNVGPYVGGISCDKSNPTITGCSINNNEGSSGIECFWADPIVTNCTISNNNGFGVFVYDGEVTITNCTISDNSSSGITSGYSRYTKLIIINCTITGNKSGGIVFERSNLSTVITNCTVSNNVSNEDRTAGGISGCPGPITNCIITGNSSARYGGGLFACSGPITNCTITGNSAYCGGGLSACSGPITNCTITDNSAEGYGGGIDGEETYGPTSPINNCTISRNSAGWDGGGLFGFRGPISNCLISGNSAGYSGGGIDYSFGPIRNCTIIGNKAEGAFGGVGGPLNKYINNCIIWNNFAPQAPQLPSRSLINYSCIQDWTIWFEGDNTNISSDPCFVEPGYWADANDPNIIVEPNNPNAIWVEGNYHLLKTSPCIDTGDPNYIPDPNETDLDGYPRLLDGDEDGTPIVDMGAYEYWPPIPADVNIEPDTLNLQSKGNWLTCRIRLPEDYNVADIDPNSIFLEGIISADSLQINNNAAVVKFSRSEVQSILSIGENEITITGELLDGTVFEGTDTIRVISKGNKK